MDLELTMEPLPTAEAVNTFIDETEAWIGRIMKKLNWSKDYLLKKEPHVRCSIDPAHFIPSSSLEKHQVLCSAAKQGLCGEDLTDQSSKFYYENATKVKNVELDDTVLWGIMAQTTADQPQDPSQSMPTRSQRLSIYEYCINAAKASDHETSIPVEYLQLLEDDSKGKEKSWLELKAEERDQKRRRQSYKNKASVHTRNKSHTQIVKEVIEGQTDILRRMWNKDSQMKQDSDARDLSELRMAGDFTNPSPDNTTSRQSRSPVVSKRSHHDKSKIKKRAHDRSTPDREETRERKKHKKHKKHKHKAATPRSSVDKELQSS